MLAFISGRIHMQDWEAEQKAKQERQHLRMADGKDPDASSSSGSDDEEELPFACYACRQCAFLSGCQPVGLRCDTQFVATLHVCTLLPVYLYHARAIEPRLVAAKFTHPTLCPCRAWADAAGPPVRTHCGHVLCERCALTRQQKSGRCPACEQPLRGVFNAATDIIAKFGLKGSGGAAAAGDAGAAPSAAAAIAAAARAAADNASSEGAAAAGHGASTAGGGWDVEEVSTAGAADSTQAGTALHEDAGNASGWS